MHTTLQAEAGTAQVPRKLQKKEWKKNFLLSSMTKAWPSVWDSHFKSAFLRWYEMSPEDRDKAEGLPNSHFFRHHIRQLRENLRFLPERPFGLREKFMESNKGLLVSVEVECVFQRAEDKPDSELIQAKFGSTGLVKVEDDGSVYYNTETHDEDTGDELSDEERSEREEGHATAEVKVTIRNDKPLRLKRTMEFLTQARNAQVNRSCGMHIHLDQRDQTWLKVAKRAKRLIKALPAIQKLVAPSRLENNYCRENKWVIKGQKYAFTHDRYKMINVKPAYQEHRTIEVRIHGGTTDFWKIIGWINLCRWIQDAPEIDKIAESRLVDGQGRLSVDIESLIRCESLPADCRFYVWRRYRTFHWQDAEELGNKLMEEGKLHLLAGFSPIRGEA